MPTIFGKRQTYVRISILPHTWDQLQFCGKFTILRVSMITSVKDWQRAKKDSEMSRILYRSNRQTFQKFQSLSKNKSQEELLENTKLLFESLNNNKKKMLKPKWKTFCQDIQMLNRVLKEK